MGISNFTLTRIFNKTHSQIIDSKIERIILISDNDYLLTLYKNGRTSNLLLSLNPSLPMFLLSSSYKESSMIPSNPNLNLLKKYLEKADILSFEKKKDDRIIILKTKKWSESYKLINSTVIIELFPLSPNIIFVDDDYTILDALKYSDTLDGKHPIHRGLKYVFPIVSDKDFNIDTPLLEMKNKINKTEYRYLETLSEIDYKNTLSRMLNETHFYLHKNDLYSIKINDEAKRLSLDELYEELIFQKKKDNKAERFSHVFKLVNQKIKSIQKRLINIEKDYQRFIEGNDYVNIGNMLYLAYDEYQKGMEEIIVDGYKIKLDPKLDLGENAQRYFKLHKKAKSGLEQVKIQKNIAKEELDYFLQIKSQLEFASYQDIEEIILDLVNNHYIKAPKTQNKAKKRPGNKKYTPHFIILPNGTKIGYGLSSFQNEELTFSLAKKEHIYLHIKDFHGPHIILFKENPTEDELRFAGECALYFAKKNSGEVYYTKRANVKKVPSSRGLVSMSSQKTMVIGNILDSSLKILKSNH